jgi:hypothetical protein
MADTFRRVTQPDGFGREPAAGAPGGPFAGPELLDRIVRAPAGDAAAMVLDLPPPIIRTVLDVLGPREVARLLLGVRADRVDELLSYVSSSLLAAALAQLSVPQVAELVPLVPVESAVRLVAHLAPDRASALLLDLPTQYRQVLWDRRPPPAPSDYPRRAAQAVRRAAGHATPLDPRGGSLQTEVFGRPVQVVVRDRPGAVFGSADLAAAIGAAEWRRVAGVVCSDQCGARPGARGRRARRPPAGVRDRGRRLAGRTRRWPPQTHPRPARCLGQPSLLRPAL